MESGLRFSARDPFDVPGQWDFMELTQRGHSRHTTNLLYGRYLPSGSDRISFRCFDYTYETGWAQSRRLHRFGVAAAISPIFFPHLIVRPISRTPHGANWINLDSVPTGDEDFDRTFEVASLDKGLVGALLSTEMRKLISTRPEWTWELTGNVVAIYRKSLLTIPDDSDHKDSLPDAIDHLCRFFHLVPAPIAGELAA